MIWENRIKKLAEKYGYREYMIRRYLEIFDEEELYEFLEACEKGLKTTIRVNTIKVRENLLLKRLEERGIVLEKIKWTKYGYTVQKANVPIGATPEYLLGYYFIQNAASMLPPEILFPKNNDIVVDMCAAPGTKTTYLAQLMNNEGTLISIDSSPTRIKALIANIQRMGIKNTIVLKMDARRLYKIGIRFDKILLDAPCTGEGLIPIDPSRKKSRKLKDIKVMSRIQLELLVSAIKSIKNDGIIVYSTCSIAPEENEYVISQALDEFRDEIKLEPININVGKPGLLKFEDYTFDERLKFAKRLYPHTDRTIGFFIAKIRKSG
ncbi:MAG: RsmB/NOP family class I SAM-dependent RNA methyltransferase [Candidatus Asgardarchaeum sp.]